MGNSFVTCIKKESNLKGDVRVESNGKVSLIQILNDDCLLQIFRYLPIADRLRVERVCRKWMYLSQQSWSDLKMLDFETNTWGMLTYQINKIRQPIFEKLLTLSGNYITSVNFHLYSKEFPNTYLKSSAIITILRKCPNIEELQIINVEPMDKKYWKKMIELLTPMSCNIRKFGLKIFAACYVDQDLGSLFATMTNLKSVFLDGIPKAFPGTCLLSLPSDIEEISFQNVWYINNDILREVIRRSEKLRTIGFSGTHNVSFDSLIEDFRLRAASLTKFILRGTNWTPEDPKQLLCTMSKLINLKTLDVKWSSFVDDKFLEVVANNCKQLRDLRIAASDNVSNQGIECISKLEKLDCLIMRNLENVSSPQMEKLYNLRILDCSSSKRIHEDSIIGVVQKADYLRLLNIAGCTEVTNKFVKEIKEPLKKRKNRTVLQVLIRGTKITEKNLKINTHSRLYVKDTVAFL